MSAPINPRQWYLVRNDLSLKCAQCGAVHPYFTDRCIERPFLGRDLFGLINEVQTTEQGRVHGHHVTVEILKLIVLRPGAAEPIKRADAQRLNYRINLRGGNGRRQQ